MMNSVQLMGRLTAMPELRQTTNGTEVTQFTLAVDRPRRKDQQENTADFIRCVAWKQTAEFICRYFCKGALIAIEGRVQTRSWEDRAGVKQYATEIIVNQVHFTGEKREQAQQRDDYSSGQQYAAPQQQAQLDPDEFEEILSDGEVPF